MENLFLSVLDDLKKKVNSGEAYPILKSSELIRQLLLDNPKIVDRMNSEFKLKIVFTYRNTSQEIDRALKNKVNYFPGDGFYPSPTKPSRISRTPISGGKDQFLAAIVGVVKGQPISVLDIIKQAGFFMGGIHVGSSQKETEINKILSEGAPYFSFIGGLDFVLLQLRSIGMVILEGLEELRKETIKKYHPEIYKKIYGGE